MMSSAGRGMAAPPPVQEDPVRSAAAIGELNALASMIGPQASAPADMFKLESLFGANIFDKVGGGTRAILRALETGMFRAGTSAERNCPRRKFVNLTRRMA